MRISKKLKRQIRYELKQNNQTNVKFSNIASKVDLNRNIFAAQNKEILTYKYFTFAFLAISVIIIIISVCFYSNVKRIEIEKNHQLRIINNAYILTSEELKEYKKLANEQNDAIRKAEALYRAFEKEFAYVIGKGCEPNPDLNQLGSLHPEYQFADGLTFGEKSKSINNDYVVAFNNIARIDLNEKEYIYIYLNTKNTLGSGERLLCYKAFLENEENPYEIGFLINSRESKFTIENKVNTNVCSFYLVDDVVVITKITVRLNGEEIVAKYVEISCNDK